VHKDTAGRLVPIGELNTALMCTNVAAEVAAHLRVSLSTLTWRLHHLRPHELRMIEPELIDRLLWHEDDCSEPIRCVWTDQSIASSASEVWRGLTRGHLSRHEDRGAYGL